MLNPARWVPAGLRPVAKSLVGAAQVFDPSRLALLGVGHVRGSVALVAVFRERYVERLHRLLKHLDPHVTVRLWSLDERPGVLRSLTAGQGPGARFVLLNKLIDTIPEADRQDGLVISDDDYSFRVGNLSQLISTGQRLDLDVWQPAHVRSSWANFRFVQRRSGVVLRRTSFVEQGPVLVLSSRAQKAMLPLPEDLGMAWGAEIRWAQLVEQHRLRLAILDAVAIHHLPPTGGYDRLAQRDQLRLMLDEAGIPSVEHLQREHSRVGLREGRRLLHG
jgi:hypothetical protein